MRRGLDFEKAEAALKRAAHKALHGSRIERSGRFLASSVIRSVEYDEDAHELDITFPSGKTYRYFDVPADVHAGLLAAESLGIFFNKEINDAYRHEEVKKRHR